MINTADISVVVQGAVSVDITKKCLQSIREYLPGAEIILSTWEGTDTSGLDYDKLMLNKDPGTKKHDFIWNTNNNVNRQLISTVEGLKKAKHKYVLKLRTDFMLTGNNFLQYFDMFPKRDSKYSVFKHRMIVPSIYSREFSDVSGVPTPFHPSDFWFFGLKSDLVDYFGDTELMSDTDLANFRFKCPYRIPYPNCTFRFPPEQYFCLSWIRRHFKDIEFYDWTDLSDYNIELSKQILANNFIFIDYSQSGITSPKHLWGLKNEYNIAGIVTYEVFLQRYKKYCDNELQLSWKNTTELRDKPKNRLLKHWYFFKAPIKKFFYWFSEIFSVLYYSVAVMADYVRNLFLRTHK